MSNEQNCIFNEVGHNEHCTYLHNPGSTLVFLSWKFHYNSGSQTEASKCIRVFRPYTNRRRNGNSQRSDRVVLHFSACTRTPLDCA